SRDAAVQGGDSGPAIVPGKPQESLLVSAIRHEGDIQMPPDDKLADSQIASITRWVQLGAPWPTSEPKDGAKSNARRHWAFQPIRQPPVPANVQKPDRHSQVVDAFIHEKLQAAGLGMSPPADRRTLIRRASFDLTGLPPSAEDV